MHDDDVLECHVHEDVLECRVHDDDSLFFYIIYSIRREIIYESKLFYAAPESPIIEKKKKTGKKKSIKDSRKNKIKRVTCKIKHRFIGFSLTTADRLPRSR